MLLSTRDDNDADIHAVLVVRSDSRLDSTRLVPLLSRALISSLLFSYFLFILSSVIWSPVPLSPTLRAEPLQYRTRVTLAGVRSLLRFNFWPLVSLSSAAQAYWRLLSSSLLTSRLF